jgi:hypothetical protein
VCGGGLDHLLGQSVAVDDERTQSRTQRVRAAGVGALVAIWTFFDAILIGLPILPLAAWTQPLIVFVIGSVVVTLINVAACGWVDRQWNVWIAGTRFENRMQKIRSGKRARRPVEWIGRGSDVWFAPAATLLNAVQVIALVRLITGHTAGSRRILVASMAYSIFYAGLFSLLGFALGDAIRATKRRCP